MYEDFIGSLDHPSHSSESGRPSREEYNATYGGYPAMPRYRFGDMSPAWKSAAEQTVNSLQPADDFATPDHGAAESSALTANSISDTHDELDVDHEFDGDLPGDLFDMNSGNVEDQQMDEEVSIIEYDDDDDEQMNEMPEGSYRLAGNQIPNPRDDFLYRVAQHMEATQSPFMQHVESSDQRMAQQAQASDRHMTQLIAHADQRLAQQIAESERRYRKLEEEINGIKVEFAAVRRENTSLKNNYTTFEAKWRTKYEALEKKKTALEAQLEAMRNQSNTERPNTSSVESVLTGVIATTVQTDTVAAPSSDFVATAKAVKPCFQIHIYVFVTKDRKWEFYVQKGTTGVIKHKNANELGGYELLIDIMRRLNRTIGLKFEDAQPAIKIQNLNDDFGTTFDEADASEVTLWLEQVRKLWLAGINSNPIMKLGWYSGKFGDQAKSIWTDADC